MIILYAIIAVIVILAAVVLIRTAAIKAPPRPAAYRPDEAGEAVCAEKLGAMVRVPTVSRNEDEDLSEFYRYHALLEELFPLVHKNLEKTVLSGNLIYRWKGADSSARPILLMGHQDVVPASDEGWSVPAFSGTVKDDGCIYGRGA